MTWTWTLDFNRDSWKGSGHLFDGRTSKAEAVGVSWDRKGITLSRESGRLFVPEENCRIESTQPGNLRVRLDNPEDSVLVLSDPEAARPLKYLDGRWGGSLRHAPLAARLSLLILSTALIVLLFFTWVFPFMVGRTAAAIPVSLEEKLGEKALRWALASDTVNSDSAVNFIFHKIGGFLDSLDLSHDRRFKIVLVENQNVSNAFALPGGIILIYRGLLRDISGQEELLGILAHEAGHVYHRHSAKALIRTLALGAFFTLFFGDVSGLSAVLLENSQTLLSLNYNRKMEMEADNFAIEGLQSRGYSAAGLRVFFNRVKQKPQPLEMLSTHPGTEKRLKNIEGRLKPMPSSAVLLEDFEWNLLKD